MSNESVLLERRGAVAVVRLNRPEVHNAVDAAVIEGLEAAVDAVEDDPDVRAVVLAGAGERTFCAGGDLSYFEHLPTGRDAVAMSRRVQAVLSRLEDGPRPVIGALAGDVLGGGCEIAVACHLRIAGEGIRFSFRPAALGIVTGWGGGRRLFRLVGRSAALRLFLLAETITSDEALRLGLVDRVVPRGQVDEEAVAWGERIAAVSSASVRSFLELDRTIRTAAPEEVVVETETRLFGELWDGEDFRRSHDDWLRRRELRARGGG